MNTVTKSRIQGLYAITDPSLCPNDQLLAKVEAAIQGGAKVLQYRDKTQSTEVQIKMASRLVTLCRQHNVCFIINDDIQLAKTVQADGVHLGKDDSAIESARETLGQNAIIGISCYNSLQRAQQMQQAGADYVAFGRFFPSRSKPQAPQADLQTLIQAREQLEIPIVAIGGINRNNAHQVIGSGADSVAVIQGVFAHETQTAITEASRQISTQFTL
ncbi:thiamine phosphate synthase [Thiomicrorhabdus xiamenensis]|uniref:Thiamine-phosphate synthase n=1 Tax=Thiomicrorhabdus xiamenensis TaxID=2739063 RepID=A0A7D4NR19_9GAMM|nr:thiamine phosphate synthase [Thiomicrorhabdus xiamenensis]QKI89472.1 thiamine phosphate synthase [Thiomicrorhabdus xiamenensis]